MTLGYSSAAWDASAQAHRDAAERKYSDAQQRIKVAQEETRIEQAAVARQALLDRQAKEETKAKAREQELRLAQITEERRSIRESEEAQARQRLKEQRRLAAQRRRAERKAREIAAEEHEESVFRAKLAARRAAADAQISRLDEQRSVRYDN